MQNEPDSRILYPLYFCIDVIFKDESNKPELLGSSNANKYVLFFSSTADKKYRMAFAEFNLYNGKSQSVVHCGQTKLERCSRIYFE
jgi:hypothetical protein